MRIVTYVGETIYFLVFEFLDCAVVMVYTILVITGNNQHNLNMCITSTKLSLFDDYCTKGIVQLS